MLLFDTTSDTVIMSSVLNIVHIGYQSTCRVSSALDAMGTYHGFDMFVFVQCPNSHITPPVICTPVKHPLLSHRQINNN